MIRTGRVWWRADKASVGVKRNVFDVDYKTVMCRGEGASGRTVVYAPQRTARSGDVAPLRLLNAGRPLSGVSQTQKDEPAKTGSSSSAVGRPVRPYPTCV